MQKFCTCYDYTQIESRQLSTRLVHADGQEAVLYHVPVMLVTHIIHVT